jgi:hypothetical protein
MQVWEGKQTDEKKERANGELKTQNLVEAASDLIKESIPSAQTNEDPKILDLKTGDAPKGVSEKRILANGVSNGC